MICRANKTINNKFFTVLLDVADQYHIKKFRLSSMQLNTKSFRSAIYVSSNYPEVLFDDKVLGHIDLMT